MGEQAMVKVMGRWLAALGVAAAAAMGCGSSVGDGGGGGEGGAGVQCSDFADEAGTQVTVRFTNGTPGVIYLGSMNGCGGLNPFTVRDQAGQERPWYLDACGFTCADLQEHSGACAADCAIPPVYRIDPGGHYDVQWTGLLLEQREMPAACFAEPATAAASCQQQVLATAGSYDLTGTVYTAVQGCDPASGTCDCTPSAEGWCEMPWSAQPSGNPVTATVTAALPETALVEIAFQ